MTKLAACLLVVTIAFAGCFKKKDDCPPVNTVAPQTEQARVQAYLDSMHITTAIRHSSGLYYEIVDPGSGNAPDRCSSVHVSYRGSFTNGTVFESNSNIYLKLNVLIDGWRLGLPLIKKSGHIRMYIPPTLGYGASGKWEGSTAVIPPNSILIYDVTLVDL